MSSSKIVVDARSISDVMRDEENDISKMFKMCREFEAALQELNNHWGGSGMDRANMIYNYLLDDFWDICQSYEDLYKAVKIARDEYVTASGSALSLTTRLLEGEG